MLILIFQSVVTVLQPGDDLRHFPRISIIMIWDFGKTDVGSFGRVCQYVSFWS